jgi:anion-transporting  ArsA/GET3 family ATPase
MILDLAIETTEDICDALKAEIAVARGERVLIRNIDVPGLNERAAKRAEFNKRTAQLQLQLAAQLRAVADDLGLAEVTLVALETRLPVAAQRLAVSFANIRSLATALHELDALNRALGQRALTYVKAHLAILCPRPVSYDRRGASPTVPRSSTHIRVA